MKKSTKQLVLTALLAALVCVATMIIRIPSPFKGYINLGDGIVLFAGWLLSPLYGFLAAGFGSALADIFSGYAVYAPATFVIKGLTALTAFYITKLVAGKTKELPSLIVGGIAGEVIMVLGYYVFEGFMYGFIPSAVNIAPNAVQGAAGLILGVLLIRIFRKTKIKL